MSIATIFNMMKQIYNWVKTLTDIGYETNVLYPNKSIRNVVNSIMEFSVGDSSHTVYSLEDIDSEFWRWIRANRPTYSTEHLSDADIIREYQKFIVETYLDENHNISEDDIFKTWTEVKRVYKILK